MSYSSFDFVPGEGQILNTDVAKISTVTTVLARYRQFPEKTLFQVLNAKLNVSASSAGAGTLAAVHSFGKDDSGDDAYVVHFELDGMNLHFIANHSLVMQGYMTSANFYDRAGGSPFDDAVEDVSDEYGANFGYPYKPPKVSFKGFSFPLPVEVRHTFSVSDSYAEQMMNDLSK